MIEITYLDASKNERTVTFESYEDFDRSQQACLIGVADYYPVQKLTYNGHDLDYHGTYGDVFFYLMKQDLSQMCIRDSLWAEGFLLDKGRNIRVLRDFLDQILIMKTARLTFEYVSDTFHLISSFF